MGFGLPDAQLETFEEDVLTPTSRTSNEESPKSTNYGPVKIAPHQQKAPTWS